MHSTHHRKALLASLVSTVFLAAGCGGGGSSDTSSALPDEVSSDADKLAVDSPEAMAQALSWRRGGTPPASSAGVLLGSTSLHDFVDTNPDGLAEAFIFVAGASGNSTTLNLYLDSSNTALRVDAGIYADVDGSPGRLLTSGLISAPKAGAWNAITVPSVSLTAGARYWIAVLTPVGYGNIKMRDLVSGGGGTVTSAQHGLGSLPDSWQVGRNYTNSPISAYLTLTADSGSTTPPAPAPTPAPSPKPPATSPAPAPAPTHAPAPSPKPPAPAPSPAPTPAPAPKPPSAPAPAPAAPTATLSWADSTSPGVTGYRVYYGLASHSYLQAAGSGVSVGNTTTYVVTGLQSKKTYYFAMTSIDASGHESVLSSEVSKLTP